MLLKIWVQVIVTLLIYLRKKSKNFHIYCHQIRLWVDAAAPLMGIIWSWILSFQEMKVHSTHADALNHNDDIFILTAAQGLVLCPNIIVLAPNQPWLWQTSSCTYCLCLRLWGKDVQPAILNASEQQHLFHEESNRAADADTADPSPLGLESKKMLGKHNPSEIASNGFGLGSVYPSICLAYNKPQRVLFRYGSLLCRTERRIRCSSRDRHTEKDGNQM